MVFTGSVSFMSNEETKETKVDEAESVVPLGSTRKMKDSQETSQSSKNSQLGQGSIDKYAIQCAKCSKWRLLPTPEEFEEVRRTFTEDPYICTKKPNTSCDDPSDIDYDTTRTWIMDKPNLPKTPKGFKRHLVLRRDYSKLDSYYVTPTGKRLRSCSDIAAYIEANPEHKDVNISDFSFNSPKIMEETIPDHIERKSFNSAGRVKRIKSPKEAADV